MHYLKRPQLFLLAFALALLQACAQMPGVPKDFNGYAADTIQATDAAVSLTRTLLAAKKISSKDAESVLKVAETTRDGVAIARSVLVAEGQAAGISRIRLAAKAAEDLNKYLLERKGS